MKNTFGSDLSLTIFGESHGWAVGAVLDGMAAGVPVDEAFVAACMDKRRARGDGLSTPRTEADAVQFLSGVVNGCTTGTAIALMVENQNTRSADYAKTADLLRPGHADYTAYAKYHGFQDARGGGHFSGRVTAALVAGGAVVLGALSRAGIDISTHIAACAGISDTRFALDDAAALAAQVEALADKPEGFAVLDPAVEEPMKAAIRAAGADGDSVGGLLETAILGLPAGIGEPYFDSVESKIAHLAFSIPAVKGIEFGTGFDFAGLRGSEANDAFRMTPEGAVVTASNHNAGINGGIANGMPVVFRTVVKPTPSIYKQQDTVDYLAKKNAELSTSMGAVSSEPSLRLMCRRERRSSWERSFSSIIQNHSFLSGNRYNGQHCTGGKAGGGLILVGKPAEAFADVIRAGRIHKPGCTVLDLNVDGIVTGVHIIGLIHVQRQVHGGVVVAVDQLGPQPGAGSVHAAHHQQHSGNGQNDHGKQKIGKQLFVFHALILDL